VWNGPAYLRRYSHPHRASKGFAKEDIETAECRSLRIAGRQTSAEAKAFISGHISWLQGQHVLPHKSDGSHTIKLNGPIKFSSGVQLADEPHRSRFERKQRLRITFQIVRRLRELPLSHFILWDNEGIIQGSIYLSVASSFDVRGKAIAKLHLTLFLDCNHYSSFYPGM
jgi:hypothetical protein